MSTDPIEERDSNPIGQNQALSVHDVSAAPSSNYLISSETGLGSDYLDECFKQAKALCLESRALIREKNCPQQGLDRALEAVDAFRGILRVRETPRVICWLAASELNAGRALMNMGRYDEALTWWRSANARRQQQIKNNNALPNTTMKLANGLYELAEGVRLHGHEKQSVMRRLYVRVCEAYEQAFRQAPSEHLDAHIEAYIFSTRVLTVLSGTQREKAFALKHVRHARALSMNSTPNWAVEYEATLATKLIAEVEKSHTFAMWQVFIVCLLQILPLLLTRFGSTGFVVAVFLQTFLPIGINFRHMHSGRRRLVAATAQYVASLCVAFMSAFVDPSIPFKLIVLLPLLPLFVNVHFNTLLREFSAFHILASYLGRVGRRSDVLADKCAEWVATKCPLWIQPFVIHRDVAHKTVRLRAFFRLLACTWVVVSDSRELLSQLVVICFEIVAAPKRPPVQPPWMQNRVPSTCWSVLLRCPLHLARGDDLAVCY